MAYTNFSTRIVINRNLSKNIPVQSSVRQGCLLSPLLFALYLEPLYLSAVRCPTVHVFKLHSAEVKLLAYANDVGVFVSDVKSVSEVFRLQRHLTKYPGQL